MDFNDYGMGLEDIIADIRYWMATLDVELEKAHKQTASARRARKATLHLTKLFKMFRKVSCSEGLK